MTSKRTRSEAGEAPDLEARFHSLRWWNVTVGLVIGAQAIVIASLQNGFSVPIVTT